MFKALLTFSNGETLELCDGQTIFPISKHMAGDDVSTSQYPPCELWNHSSAGMIPSVTELLCKYDFFQLSNDDGKVYKSSAVVTIENL